MWRLAGRLEHAHCRTQHASATPLVVFACRNVEPSEPKTFGVEYGLAARLHVVASLVPQAVDQHGDTPLNLAADNQSLALLLEATCRSVRVLEYSILCHYGSEKMLASCNPGEYQDQIWIWPETPLLS